MDATPIRTITNSSTGTLSVSSGAETLGQSRVVSRDSGDNVVPPLSHYRELTGQPYATTFFGVSLYANDPMFAEYAEMAAYLDQFVIAKIAELKLQNTTESFDEIMSKFVDQIGEYNNEDPLNRLRRFFTAADATSRLESAKIEPVLDATNLAPDEYQTLYGTQIL